MDPSFRQRCIGTYSRALGDVVEGFRVEFRHGPDRDADVLIFHQQNGTFVARRAWVAALAESGMSESAHRKVAQHMSLPPTVPEV
jgi:hypothetical protein